MANDIHQRLEEVINQTEPGGKLPSEPTLAGMLGVSRATLREAMRTFETQGRLRRRQGVGTFVLHPSLIIESGLEILQSIETLADQIGLTVSMGDLKIENQTAVGRVVALLQSESGTELLRVSRVIRAEDRPVAFLVDLLPKTTLSKEEIHGGFTGSVLDLLLKRGNPILETSRCEIAAVGAEQEIAKALNIQRNDAVLCFEAILYAVDGLPIDYSLSYFLPGYFRFHVVRRVDRPVFNHQ